MSQIKRTRPKREQARSSADRAAPNASVPPSASPRMVDATRASDAPPSTADLFNTSEPRWWGYAGEWLRGKAELAWETRIIPALGWLGMFLGRFGNRWGRSVRIPERRMRGTGPLRVWSIEEQGVRMLKRITRLLMIIAVGAAAIVIFAAAATRLAAFLTQSRANLSVTLNSATATPASGLTILNGDGGDVTPVGIPAYTLGLWMSNNSPGVGEPTTVYVKLTHYSAPVPDVRITLTVGGGPTVVTTNAEGMATLRVFSNGPGAVPVEIDGAVTIDGQNLTASTFFTPL